MRTTQQFSITLPVDMAQLVKSKVSSGEYASESEVFRDGLRALAARDKAVEAWLLTDVAMAYDDATINPSSLISSQDARATLRTRHESRVKSGA